MCYAIWCFLSLKFNNLWPWYFRFCASIHDFTDNIPNQSISPSGVFVSASQSEFFLPRFTFYKQMKTRSLWPFLSSDLVWNLNEVRRGKKLTSRGRNKYTALPTRRNSTVCKPISRHILRCKSHVKILIHCGNFFFTFKVPILHNMSPLTLTSAAQTQLYIENMWMNFSCGMKNCSYNNLVVPKHSNDLFLSLSKLEWWMGNWG